MEKKHSNYETVFIVNAELGDEQRDAILKWITKKDLEHGTLLNVMWQPE